jgi:hypothetical protein
MVRNLNPSKLIQKVCYKFSINKPQFKYSIWRLCAKYMGVSIILVKNQNSQDMVDPKAKLDEEFEYLGINCQFMG